MTGRSRAGADLDWGVFLQGAVSGCHGWWALLWPKSSSSQVGPQNDNVLIRRGGEGRERGRGAGLCLMLSLCLLPGRRVGGQTALEMGLVNRAVDQNQAGDAAYREALSLAREILPQVSCSHPSHPTGRGPAHHPWHFSSLLSSDRRRSVFFLYSS